MSSHHIYISNDKKHIFICYVGTFIIFMLCSLYCIACSLYIQFYSTAQYTVCISVHTVCSSFFSSILLSSTYKEHSFVLFFLCAFNVLAFHIWSGFCGSYLVKHIRNSLTQHHLFWLPSHSALSFFVILNINHHHTTVGVIQNHHCVLS